MTRSHPGSCCIITLSSIHYLHALCTCLYDIDAMSGKIDDHLIAIRFLAVNRGALYGIDCQRFTLRNTGNDQLPVLRLCFQGRRRSSTNGCRRKFFNIYKIIP